MFQKFILTQRGVWDNESQLHILLDKTLAGNISTLVVEYISFAPDDLFIGSAGEDLPDGGLERSSSVTSYSKQYGLSPIPVGKQNIQYYQ